MDQLGPRLRALRLQAGITQADAARHAGVNVTTWAKWEAGHAHPRLHRSSDIANALAVPVAALTCPDGYTAIADIILSPVALARLQHEGEHALNDLTNTLATQLRTHLAHATHQATKPKPSPRGRASATDARKALRSSRVARAQAQQARAQAQGLEA